MKCKLTVLLFLLLIIKCNGQLSLLGDILSAAHDRIQSRVEGVADTVLGGLNLNFLGKNRQNLPVNEKQKGPQETIIVVVEESGNNDYGPPNTNNQDHINHRPPPHHHRGPRPPPLHHHEGPPPPPPDYHDGPPPPPPDYHDGPPPPPFHHHRRPPHPPPRHHHHRPHGDPRPGYDDQNQDPYYNEYEYNQNPDSQENNHNFYGNNQSERPYDNNNGHSDNNKYRPNSKDTEEYQGNYNNQKHPDNVVNTEPVNKKPTTEYITTPTSTKSSPLSKNDKTNDETEKTPDDKPLFVPLSPNEYIYGGDKINITAPKRDTEKNQPVESSDDDDFSIDVRLKDE